MTSGDVSKASTSTTSVVNESLTETGDNTQSKERPALGFHQFVLLFEILFEVLLEGVSLWQLKAIDNIRIKVIFFFIGVITRKYNICHFSFTIGFKEGPGCD